MFRPLALLFAATALLTSPAADAQNGELNLLTDLGTPFPPGCLSIDLPEQPRNEDSLIVDQNLTVPSLYSNSFDSTIRIRVWRVACADEGYSVVLVRLRRVNGGTIVVPQVFAEAGDVTEPLHEAQLLQLPGAGNVGASGGIITNAGTTWMLGVDPFPLAGDTVFLPEDYNGTFSLEFNWGSYAPARPEGFTVLVDEFVPAIDPPQFDQPVLNGRYSGQWVVTGAERQGLVLQVAERPEDNFVFAIFFTYLDGEPVWLAGNTTPRLIDPGPITMDSFIYDGGAFIADANQPPASQIQGTNAGPITIEPIDCNRISVAYDFSPIGKGSGSVVMERLVRIAGYDCNPWE